MLSLCAAALACAGSATASNVWESDLDLIHAKWPAKWITCPGIEPRGPVVCHFRKTITLAGAPADPYPIHVSADNRFILFVNGTRVGEGPARGDLDHWRYETFNIARLLRPGKNLIAATVWNCGAMAPMAQISDQTAFLVQGGASAESDVDTDGTWEVEQERGQGFEPVKFTDLPNYYAASPTERLDGALYDWDWNTPASKGDWKPAVTACGGEPGRFPDAFPIGTGSGLNRWQLVPDPLPHMEFLEVPAGRIVPGADSVPGFPATIPAHSSVSILIDREAMTTGFPEIRVSAGKGSTVKVTYAEALVDAAGKKGNRNETANRRMLGLNDTFVADGGGDRVWSPLWWRAWRYLQVEVRTGTEPLVIASLGARFSGFPFEELGAF